MKELKYALTDKLWNKYTSTEEKVQHQGINQGFRIIGGKTKDGKAVRAFRMNTHPVWLDELNKYIPVEHQIDAEKLWKESKYSLKDAKKLFPEWYERRVEQKQPAKKWDIKGKVHGDDPYALYHWWIRQIRSGATYGHRYFCIMSLVIYAIKNEVDEKTLENDIRGLMTFLNGLNPSEPFTWDDVESALECYEERYYRFPRQDISKLSGIEIKANRRNRLPQKIHLKAARDRKATMKDAGLMKPEGNPAKRSKEDIIREYIDKNPVATPNEMIKALNISRSTGYKWWKIVVEGGPAREPYYALFYKKPRARVWKIITSSEERLLTSTADFWKSKGYDTDLLTEKQFRDEMDLNPEEIYEYSDKERRDLITDFEVFRQENQEGFSKKELKEFERELLKDISNGVM